MKIQLQSKSSFHLPTFQEISKNCQTRYRDLKNEVTKKIEKTSFDKDTLIKTAKENKFLFGATAVAVLTTPFAVYALFSGSSEEQCIETDANANITNTSNNSTNNATSLTSYDFTDFSTLTSAGTVTAALAVATIGAGLVTCFCVNKCSSDSEKKPTIEKSISTQTTMEQSKGTEKKETSEEEKARRDVLEKSLNDSNSHALAKEHLTKLNASRCDGVNTEGNPVENEGDRSTQRVENEHEGYKVQSEDEGDPVENVSDDEGDECDLIPDEGALDPNKHESLEELKKQQARSEEDGSSSLAQQQNTLKSKPDNSALEISSQNSFNPYSRSPQLKHILQPTANFKTLDLNSSTPENNTTEQTEDIQVPANFVPLLNSPQSTQNQLALESQEGHGDLVSATSSDSRSLPMTENALEIYS